ncbi:MAG TPA: metallophosphoesterase [Anaerolineales bacterium]|nr:metallophosphoesterase [Anaerolineales bacterium]
MKTPISRRDFLRGSLLLSGAALSGCRARPAAGRTRVLRVAHVTDIHVEARSRARVGMAQAFGHIHAQQEAPDFILNTGDSIMDGLATPKEYALARWETFATVIRETCRIPVYHAIGNHDVWGWGLPQADTTDPLYGKGMALQALGLAQRYYAFTSGGWRFIVLDSTHPQEIESEIPYTGRLDEEQYAWLEAELVATDAATPVCVASHIPILCACEFFDGDLAVSGNWVVPGAWMHIDAGRLRQLFLAHPNVCLCLSGHAHQVDRVEYLGVRYSCDGAISGNWWQGAYLDCQPGYVMVDLYDDGSSEIEFVAYEAG